MMTTTSDISAAVRRARKGMGRRQDDLAAAAGVGLRFLVGLERGKPTEKLGRTLSVLAAVGLELRAVARSPTPDPARLS